MRFFRYVLKTLWRHRRRTLLTVSGTAVALFVFCFVTAVQQGLDALTRSREADQTLIVFQANRFCPATSRLPNHYLATLERVAGVRSVMPVKVYTNNCRASLDVVVFHGVPPAQLRDVRKITVVSGAWDQFVGRRDGALVGEAVARRRGINPGDKFSLGGISVTVGGIFSSPLPAEEDFVYTDLEFLQRTPALKSVGTVTQFEVQIDPNRDPLSVAQAIDEQFRSGPIQTDTRPKGVFQASTVADLAEFIGLARWLGYACLAVVLALVSTTTLMAVQDRVQEHAVLATLGFSSRRIFGLVISESLLVSLASGMLGVSAALATLALGRFSVGTEGVTIAFSPSIWLLASGLAVSAVLGIAAGLLPAWQTSRLDIVRALRQM